METKSMGENKQTCWLVKGARGRVAKKLMRTHLWKKCQRADRADKDVARLEELMRGSPGIEWEKLATFNSFTSHVYLYDLGSRSIQSSCGLPWPIRWLLGRFSRKHVFQNRQLPCMENLVSDLKNFENPPTPACRG